MDAKPYIVSEIQNAQKKSFANMQRGTMSRNPHNPDVDFYSSFL